MLISIPSSTARLFIAVVFIAFFALTTPAYSGQTQVSCASGNIYTIKGGDNCYAIATANGVSLDALVAANPTGECNSLQVGQTLCIPPKCSGSYYSVKRNDYCDAIASAGGVTLDKLLAANPGINSDCSNLQIGELLCLPSSCSGSTHSVTAGDTCSAIAAANGIALEALIAANPGVDCGNLQIGQNLCVPSPPLPAGAVVGFWHWTWSASSGSPAGTNLGIAFSGYVDPNQALAASAAIKNSLPGQKFLSLGGGNALGSWSRFALQSITEAIKAGSFSGYQGLAYDIEEASESGLYPAFADSFNAARSAGLKVMVTTSHSSPYGVPDGPSLMAAFLADSNIDYISPQLYTSGTEAANDFTESVGVPWSAYKGAKPLFVPSIVDSSMYASAVSYFQTIGITPTGFAQWKQLSSMLSPMVEQTGKGKAKAACNKVKIACESIQALIRKVPKKAKIACKAAMAACNAVS